MGLQFVTQAVDIAKVTIWYSREILEQTMKASLDTVRLCHGGAG
jgi:hypothetical protein